jgi:hypothetical protein
MKNKILVFCLLSVLFISANVSGQSAAKLSPETIQKLEINSEVVTKVEVVLTEYSGKLRTMMTDHNLKGPERKKRMDQIFKEREDKLKGFLSAEQMDILFAAQKEHARKRMEENRKMGRPKLNS